MAAEITIPQVNIQDIITDMPSMLGCDSLQSAIQAYSRGDFHGALTQLRELSDNNKSINKHFYIGNCLYRMGIKDEAEIEWLKSAKIDKSSCVYVNLGNLYFDKNDFGKALKFWHKALTIEPEQNVANYNIAICYSKQDYRDLAITYYKKFLKYYNSDYSDKSYNMVKAFIAKIESKCDVFSQRATEALAQKDYDTAVAYYLKVLYNNPCKYSISKFLGSLYFRVKNYQKSVEYHLLAYRNDPDHTTSIMNIGLAFDKLGYENYAYCFYRRILPYIMKDEAKYNSVLTLLKKVVPNVVGKQQYIQHHLDAAHEYEDQGLYQRAIEEYENTIYIINEKENELAHKISKLKQYINPERNIIAALHLDLDKEFGEQNYEKVVDICTRIILLAPENSREYEMAFSRRNTAYKRLKTQGV